MCKFQKVLCIGLIVGLLLSQSACMTKGGEDGSSVPQISGSYDSSGGYQPEVPDVSQELKAAMEKNSDVMGWLMIPGTTVNEAVVQTTNNDYYLRRDVEKKYAYEGCYYLDYESVLFDDGKDLPQNTIIYGHNLGNPMGVKDDPDGVKFAQLLKFEDESFAKATPYIYFVTPGATHIFQVFAAAYCEAGTTPVPYHYAEYTDQQFLDLTADMKARSQFLYDVPIDAEDQIITLSTCSYKFGTYTQNPNQRYVVMGRLVQQGDSMGETANFRTNENPKQPSFS